MKYLHKLCHFDPVHFISCIVRMIMVLLILAELIYFLKRLIPVKEKHYCWFTISRKWMRLEQSYIEICLLSAFVESKGER